MRLHTTFITFNRLELTKRAIRSYLETVTVPYTAVVVDNNSTDGTREWLGRLSLGLEPDSNDFGGIVWQLLPENRYPGFACNRGWSLAPSFATHLHRADNDFEFLPGWCDVLAEALENPGVGQVGLRTDAEEAFTSLNTGGNCAIPRRLWDEGLRYDERPWQAYSKGHSEDAPFSAAVNARGYRWRRVERPCIVDMASGSWDDPYYATSWGDRHLTPGDMTT